jgi:signal transduction histidine kinase
MLVSVQIPRWLRFIPIGVWLIAGSTSVPRLLREPRVAPTWTIAFIAFGVLFWIGSDRRASRARTIGCLVGEACLAALLAYLGMPAFEGALFSIVAAQLPLAVSVRSALAWGIAQAIVLFLALPHDYNQIEIAKSVTSYLGFAMMAIALVSFFDSERRARVELARAGERTRITRELHDVLGHHLAALTIQLDLARRKSQGEARAPLDEAYGAAQRMLKDVRDTMTTLRKDEYDLRAALDAVVKAVPEPAIDVAFPAGLVVSDAAVAHVALRCIQEAITNTVKHARAEHIRVALSREGDDLMIAIEDDGVAAGEIREGSGLRGMRERIEELGGDIEVASESQRGTAVRARLPMSPRGSGATRTRSS